MKHLRRIAEDEGRLEMTPMIDVTFLLLVFFLLTLRFAALEGKLASYLPKGAGGSPAPEVPVDPVDVRISVVEPGRRVDAAGAPWTPGAGRYDLEGRVVRYAVGPESTTDLGALRRRLAALHGRDPGRRVVLEARPGVVHGDLVPVLEAALDAGFTDVAFAGAGR